MEKMRFGEKRIGRDCDHSTLYSHGVVNTFKNKAIKEEMEEKSV